MSDHHSCIYFNMSDLESVRVFARVGRPVINSEIGLDNCEFFLKTMVPMRALMSVACNGRSGGLGFNFQAF